MTKKKFLHELIHMDIDNRAVLLGLMLDFVAWDKNQTALMLAQLDDDQLVWLHEATVTECKRRGRTA